MAGRCQHASPARGPCVNAALPLRAFCIVHTCPVCGLGKQGDAASCAVHVALFANPNRCQQYSAAKGVCPGARGHGVTAPQMSNNVVRRWVRPARLCRRGEVLERRGGGQRALPPPRLPPLHDGPGQRLPRLPGPRPALRPCVTRLPVVRGGMSRGHSLVGSPDIPQAAGMDASALQ
eukprot:EG_transcript_20357